MLYKGQYHPGHTAHATSAGALVSGEAGVSYIVKDVIMRATAGHSNLTTPIKVAEGSGIFQSTSTSTTIVYHKDQ